MKNYKNGNTLIECILATFITSIAMMLIGSAIYRFHKIKNMSIEESREKNIIEIIAKEIKFNLNLCDLEKNFNEKKVYIELDEELEKNIINVDIKDLFIKEKEDIEIKKINNTETGVKILLDVKKYGIKEEIKKERWMEEKWSNIN